MPRKSQYSKEEIAQYGLKIVETKGIESLTARELAKSLGTTVAPIFVHYPSMEELKQDPPDDTDVDPIRDDYDLVAYSKFKIDFEYIVELLQGFVDFLDQKNEDFDEIEFEHKLLQLKEIVKEFAEDNPRLSDLLLQVLDEHSRDPSL